MSRKFAQVISGMVGTSDNEKRFIHRHLVNSEELAEGTSDRMTASQTRIGWLDPYLWTDEQIWPDSTPSPTPTPTGDALRTMVTFRKIGNQYKGTAIFLVYHPLMNMEGAEIVLMRYAKKNGKKHGTNSHSDYPKKGYGLAVGPNGQGDYFIFSAETSYDDFYDFCDSHLENLTRHFGIALRIPNPEYTGPATIHKNAIYKGVPESLYSDILPCKISYDTQHDIYGIGLI